MSNQEFEKVVVITGGQSGEDEPIVYGKYKTLEEAKKCAPICTGVLIVDLNNGEIWEGKFGYGKRTYERLS